MAFSKAQTKPAIDGAIEGAAASFGANLIGPEYGPAVGTAVAAYVRKDAWGMHMAGYQLGAGIANRAPVLGGGLGPRGVL